MLKAKLMRYTYVTELNVVKLSAIKGISHVDVLNVEECFPTSKRIICIRVHHDSVLLRKNLRITTFWRKITKIPKMHGKNLHNGCYGQKISLRRSARVRND